MALFGLSWGNGLEIRALGFERSPCTGNKFRFDPTADKIFDADGKVIDTGFDEPCERERSSYSPPTSPLLPGGLTGDPRR